MFARIVWEIFGEDDKMDVNIKNIDNLGVLFEVWKKAQFNDGLYETLRKYTKNILPEAFARDGMVNAEKFCKMDYKVLYILSESNADGHIEGQKEQSNWSFDSTFRDFATKGEDWKSRLKTKICEMQRIILQNELGVDLNLREAVLTIAVMNLNKRGGGNKISSSYFSEYFEPYVKKHSDLIKREIEIINPDLIVCCGDKTSYLTKCVLTDIYKKRVLDMWHPSYWQIKGNVKSKNCLSINNANISKYIAEFEKRYSEFKQRGKVNAN